MPTPPRDDEPDEPLGADVRPGDEPGDAGDGDAVDGGPSGEPRPEPDHDALWQAIVANYGDRPDPSGWDDDPAPDRRGGHPAGRGRAPVAHEDDEPDSDVARDPEERFVPPVPPPLPWVAPPRFAAWCGVLGVPVLVLVLLLLNVSVSPWIGTLLMVWFVGGFAYLVASMRTDHDGPDDGAVV